MEYRGYTIKKEKWAFGDYAIYDEMSGEDMGFKTEADAKFWVDAHCEEHFETAEETRDRMWELGILMRQHGWDYDMNQKIWDMCLRWNMEHEDSEIFMCEHENDEGEVDGFYIEDDYLTFEF